MKILFVGSYREGTGASKASLSIINSIRSTGIDLSIRSIKLNRYQPELPSEILELENKSSKDSDIIINHIPPDHLIYNSKFKKNIAYISYHTNNFSFSDWPERLNMMDEIWVPSKFVENCCIRSGVNKPIRIVPLGYDESIFLQKREVYPQIKKEKHGDYLFYTISSSFSRRKNFGAFVKAFHLEFGKDEPVNMVVKFHKPNEVKSPHEFIQELKNGLNLGHTKQEIVLTSDYLKDSDIYNIHNSCDTFVSTSYGEGWCIPAFEAMGFGKTPIVNSFSGCDYIDDSTGWKVDYSLEPVFGMERGQLFSGRELWGSVSIPSLQKCMREAYESRNIKSDAGLEKVFEYSYNKIGSLIKKAIYE